jgi:hypothetical protein
VLSSQHHEMIDESIEANLCAREPLWTESIAVGSESFVGMVSENTKNRSKLTIAKSEPSQWTISEEPAAYNG